MKKEDGELIYDYTFLKKKDHIWILVLLFGGVFLSWAFCVDVDVDIAGIRQYVNQICSTEMKCRVWRMIDEVFNIVVTYSTMLVAVVVFFYSVMDNKRLGIPYRRLIAYTIGSRTIPVLFVTVLVLTVFMAVVRLVPLRYTACICEMYILLIQVCVIIQILLSTSYQYCKWMICKIEKKRYNEGAGLEQEYDTEWAYFFCHLERAVHSEDFLPDKRELLMDYLWIPFERSTGKLCQKLVNRKKLGETKELERIYQFYFVNILSAFQNFNGDEKYLERNQLYRCIGDFVLELSNKNRENMKNDTGMQYVYHAVLSGIMNGLVSSNAEGNIDFCEHILSKCMPNGDIVRRQMHLFVLFQEVLMMINLQMVTNSLKFKNLEGWQSVKTEDVAFCAKYWQIWNQMYELSFWDKMIHFEYAMQTMSGRSNMSVAIFEMIIAMKGKDTTKEKGNGQGYIIQDTTAEK